MAFATKKLKPKPHQEAGSNAANGQCTYSGKYDMKTNKYLGKVNK